MKWIILFGLLIPMYPSALGDEIGKRIDDLKIAKIAVKQHESKLTLSLQRGKTKREKLVVEIGSDGKIEFTDYAYFIHSVKMSRAEFEKIAAWYSELEKK